MSANISTSDSHVGLITKVGLILLSLDSVSNRFEHIHLRFLHPARVKESARKCLALVSGSDGVPHASDSIRQLGEQLEAVGDSEDSSLACAWLRRFVSLRKAQQLSDSWGAVLLLFNQDYATALRQIGVRDESISTVLRVADEWGNRLTEIELLGDTLEKSVVSDWDRACYREYQKESDLVTPIQFLSSWLRTEAILNAMRLIAQQFSPQELKIFEGWGKAVAEVQTSIPESRLSLENLSEMFSI